MKKINSNGLPVKLEAKLFDKYVTIGYYRSVGDALADSEDWKEIKITILK